MLSSWPKGTATQVAPSPLSPPPKSLVSFSTDQLTARKSSTSNCSLTTPHIYSPNPTVPHHPSVSATTHPRLDMMPSAPLYPVQAGLPQPMHFRGLTLGALSPPFPSPRCCTIAERTRPACSRSTHLSLPPPSRSLTMIQRRTYKQADWINLKEERTRTSRMCSIIRGRMEPSGSSWSIGVVRGGRR